MRDLTIMFIHPQYVSLDDLVKSFDAEILIDVVEDTDTLTEQTLLIRDRWARERFAIARLCYPWSNKSILEGVTTHKDLESARESLIKNLDWYVSTTLIQKIRQGDLQGVSEEFLDELRALFHI